MKLAFPRVAPAVIIVGSLSAEATLQPGLQYERCGDYVDTAYCHRTGLEPWNFHTSERGFEEPPIPAYGYIASGAVNSMTSWRGQLQRG